MSATTTAVRERPILFSGDMVRAILDGRKTRTRRVVKPQPIPSTCGGQEMWGHRDLAGDFGAHVFPACFKELVACPYGVPSDRLWVREAWWHHKSCRPPFEHTGPDGCVRYEASEAPHATEKGRWLPEWYDKKRSIHMPRWASRITLEVTAVRVERVQQITFDDACDEGFDGDYVPCLDGEGEWSGRKILPQHQFRSRWDALNAKRGFGWDVNPWVWVLEFRKVES